MKITVFEHLRKCSEAAKAFAGTLVGELANTTAAALTEMEEIKADKPGALSVTIPASGWVDGSGNAVYPKYYDISVEGITEKDRAEITIAPGSLDTAKSCGLCPTNESIAGKIRILASRIPSGDISAQCWIESGKE